MTTQVAARDETGNLLLEVELRPLSEPIEGCLHVAGRPTRRFHGWLDFATAVEECRQEAAHAPSDPPVELTRPGG